MEYSFYYETIIGRIRISEDGTGITKLILQCEANEVIPSEETLCETELIKRAAGQLIEYLEGTRTEFTVPLHLKGTKFQVKVWEALITIPYGETRSYKQIAEAIQSPRACRAVGMANHNNPVLLMVPCHRVIGADGSLTGFGAGLDVKKSLLDIEKTFRKGEQHE